MAKTICGEWGIRTPEGLHPTRFPSVRHRPLGEFSWRDAGEITRRPQRILRDAAPRHYSFSADTVNSSRLLAWRHPGQLPQGGNAARVTGLWRVREGSFFVKALVESHLLPPVRGHGCSQWHISIAHCISLDTLREKCT